MHAARAALLAAALLLAAVHCAGAAWGNKPAAKRTTTRRPIQGGGRRSCVKQTGASAKTVCKLSGASGKCIKAEVLDVNGKSKGVARGCDSVTVAGVTMRCAGASLGCNTEERNNGDQATHCCCRSRNSCNKGPIDRAHQEGDLQCAAGVKPGKPPVTGPCKTPAKFCGSLKGAFSVAGKRLPKATVYFCDGQRVPLIGRKAPSCKLAGQGCTEKTLDTGPLVGKFVLCCCDGPDGCNRYYGESVEQEQFDQGRGGQQRIVPGGGQQSEGAGGKAGNKGGKGGAGSGNDRPPDSKAEGKGAGGGGGGTTGKPAANGAAVHIATAAVFSVLLTAAANGML